MSGVLWIWMVIFRLRFMFVSAEDYGVISNHLRFSARHDDLHDAPSCQHRIIRVELRNVHSTEHILIRSIRTTEEHTELLEGEVDLLSGEGEMIFDEICSPFSNQNSGSDLPKQLHASKLPGGSLRLGPGQVAIVPISFLPRFPPAASDQNVVDNIDENDVVECEAARASSRSAASSFQEADWRDLLEGNESNPRNPPNVRYHRNNLETESPSPYPSEKRSSRYQVSTIIVVETDRGEVELPLEVTSLRDNSFGIPDVVYFDIREDQIPEPGPVTTRPFTLQSDQESKFLEDDDEDRRIQETVSLFHAVKEREKKELRRKYDDQHNGNIDFQLYVNDLEINKATTPLNGDAPISGSCTTSINTESFANTESVADICCKMDDGVTTQGETIQIPSQSSCQRVRDTNYQNGSEDVSVAWVVDSQLRPQRSLGGESFANRDSELASETTTTWLLKNQDCYDVYMRNSGALSFQVTEVLLSRPEHMSLHIMPEKIKGGGHLSVASSPRQVINSWKDIGSANKLFGEAEVALTIPADDERHYLVTVCATSTDASTAPPYEERISRSKKSVRGTSRNSLISKQPHASQHNEYADKYLADMAEWIGTGNEGKTLGFLQIATTRDTLFVGLERADEAMRKNLRASAKSAILERAIRQESASFSTRSVLKAKCISIKDTFPETGASSRLKNGMLASCESGRDDRTLLDKNVLKTVPPGLDFHFISSGCPNAALSIAIVNVSPRSVIIMRAALVLERRDGRQNADTVLSNGKQSALLDTMGIKLRLEPLNDALSNPIAAGKTVLAAVSVTCFVDWEKFLAQSAEKFSLELRGALVLRGTTRLGMSYLDWERALKVDAFVDSNVVLDVPLTIRVVDGSIGFLIQETTHPVPSFWSMKEYSDLLDIVSSAYFPLDPSFTMASVTEKEQERLSPKYLKGVDHQFRVFSDLDMDLVVDEVAIVDGSFDQSRLPSVCDRFEAFIAERGPSDHIDLGKLTNMGLVVVRYRFAGAGAKNSEENDRSNTSLPTLCYLRVTTEPTCGIHEIPFIVYSGRFEISGNKSLTGIADNDAHPTSAQAESLHQAIVGFDNLVHWFQNTKAGFALRSVLKAPIERGNSHDRDGILLGRYLYSLVQKSTDLDTSKLNPVLLQVGAIAQGETETIPMYMTNFNPVPVSIKIVVGEVEGQSISVGRNAANQKSNANGLLDVLPSPPIYPFVNGKLEAPEPKVISGRFSGHPVNGLRQFLTTNVLARRYMNQFRFRDDISLSDFAVSKFPFLKNLYRLYAVGQFHKRLVPRRFTDAGWSLCDDSIHPPLYGPFKKKMALSGRRLPGPIIISSDRKTVRNLAICWDIFRKENDRMSDGFEVVVPPGGVVRFDVTVRSPPHSVLAKDITRFLTTGLVLSTDHGETIPILVSFEALQGKLEVSYIPLVQQHQGDGGAIQLRAGLFGKASDISSSSIKIPPHNTRSFADFTRGETIVPRNASFGVSGVPLFMKSYFLRDIKLQKVVSCNPWFEVDFLNQTSGFQADPFLGINIGTISSVIACGSINGVPLHDTPFPSFFRCALNWLTKRAELQPRGCGLPENELRSECTDSDLRCEIGGVDKIILTLKRALLISEWSDELYSAKPAEYAPGTAPLPGKSGRRDEDGVVSPIMVDSVSRAWNALQTASDAGLLLLGTTLRAVVEYNATPDEISPVTHDRNGFLEPNQLLSVAIRNITVKTVLETPRLLHPFKSSHATVHTTPKSPDAPQVVEFKPALVASVASVRLPLRNPTAVPVRVRLAVAAPSSQLNDNIRSRYLRGFQSPYVQTRLRVATSHQNTANEQWWNRGGAFFQPDVSGDMIRSPYNIAIKSGTGAQVTLINPSFSANTAFLVGCGARCGLRNEINLKKPFQADDNPALTSPIGASAAAGRTLVGRDYAHGQGNQPGNEIFTLAAGASLIVGSVGPSAFAIPYYALDEIIIPPFSEAEIGPIFFRPPGRSRQMGCESIHGNRKSEYCESQIFESMIFLENSLTGLEGVILQGKALWERVVFVDPSSNGEFGDIELRNGHTTLVFPGSMTRSKRKKPTIKEVVVHNQGDVEVIVERGYLSPTTKKNYQSDAQTSCKLSHFRVLGCRESTGIFPFRLSPGQNKSIFIEHRPQCTKKREYVMFHLELLKVDELSSRDHASAGRPVSYSSTFHSATADIFRREITLALGYEMSDRIYSSCVPISGFVGQHDESIVIIQGEIEDHNGNNSLHATELEVDCKPVQFIQSGLRVICIIIAVCGITAWLFTLCERQLWLHGAAKKFHAYMNFQTPASSELKNFSAMVGKNWSAAFRCLARVDPTSSDLQSLGREQTRQILLARFKAMGATPPQCFSSIGVANRVRYGAATTAGRQLGPGPGSKGSKSTSNDRIRTSDAIFRKFDANLVIETGLLPLQLGWRMAATRGIIDASSLHGSPITLNTEDLLRRRLEPSLPVEEILDSTKSLHDSASDLASSYGDLSDDDLLSATNEGANIVRIPISISSAVQPKGGIVTENIDPCQRRSIDVSCLSDDKIQDKNDFSSGRHLSTEPATQSQAFLQEEKFWVEKDEPKPPTKEIIVKLSTDLITNDDKVTGRECSADKIKKALSGAKSTIHADSGLGEPVAPSRQGRDKNKLEIKSQAQASQKQNSSEQKRLVDKPRPSRLNANAAAIATKEATTRTSDDEQGLTRANKYTGKTTRPKRGKAHGSRKRTSSSSHSSPLSPEKSALKPSAILPSVSPMSHSDSPSSSRILRPPPGLLPPPGFEGSPNNPFRSLSSAALPTGRCLNTFSNDDLFLPLPLSSGKSGNSADSTGEMRDFPNTHGEDPLLGFAQAAFIDISEASGDPSEIRVSLGGTLPDFDVMDFLDGILEDSNASSGTEGDDTGGLILTSKASAAPVNAISSAAESPQLLSFSSNPWATDSPDGYITSRAAAYGIAFEEQSERTQGSTGSSSLPLLTPAAIIFSNAQEGGEDKNNGSFYATLLRE